MKYMLNARLQDERGDDATSTLTLKVERASAPTKLTDFVGGAGDIFDGYVSKEFRFTIAEGPGDWAIELVFGVEQRTLLETGFGNLTPKKELRFKDQVFLITRSSWWP